MLLEILNRWIYDKEEKRKKEEGRRRRKNKNTKRRRKRKGKKMKEEEEKEEKEEKNVPGCGFKSSHSLCVQIRISLTAVWVRLP